ncbi:MAG TPA: type II and III secretion system protein family protein [Rhizomicrobium sp.]|nr:type II and III secretion system protein family protein [Rhizomicrobium sp.]
MKKPVLAIILFAALAALAGPASARHQAPMMPGEENSRVITVATRAGGPVTERITLALDKAAIVQLDTDARDVLVSNPEIVDAVVRTPRRIFLLAQKIGQTNAFFFDAQGRQILSVDIRVERDVTDLAAMIHSDLADSSVKVAALNDNIVLTGTVTNAKDASLAQDLAARFAGDPLKVVNMLKIQAHEQVMLRVRVAEVQRQIAKQFGVNLSEAASIAGVPVISQTGTGFGLVGRALADASSTQIGAACASNILPNVFKQVVNGVPTTTQTSTCAGPNNLQGVLQALDQMGLIHTLAEPNLTAVSGETAKFLAGGEFPVPVARDQFGNVTIQFKQFGVGLSFTPVVLSENLISLQVSTEVSELTSTGAYTQPGSTTTDSSGNTVSIPGATIPALQVRRAETTVELPSGGAFAIAGLMQHTNKQVLEQFPGLGDMPVLGALFRSRDYQNDETELVVVISAYLVNPTSEKKIALPTDGFQPAADAETILLGHMNAIYKRAPKAVAAAGGEKNLGFIVE